MQIWFNCYSIMKDIPSWYKHINVWSRTLHWTNETRYFTFFLSFFFFLSFLFFFFFFLSLSLESLDDPEEQSWEEEGVMVIHAGSTQCVSDSVESWRRRGDWALSWPMIINNTFYRKYRLIQSSTTCNERFSPSFSSSSSYLSSSSSSSKVKNMTSWLCKFG